jgi:hypothetical protein
MRLAPLRTARGLAVTADPWDLARLELVKWVAFAAMIFDHVDLWLFGRALGFHVIGQFAFPAFALCFGLGLARADDRIGVALRLLVPASIAQAMWVIGGFDHPANVLFVFALCALASLSWPQRFGAPLAWTAAVLLAGALGEGGAFGVIMACAGFYAARSRDWRPVLGAGVLWLALAPSWGALAAFAAVVLLPPRVVIPRVRGLLAWGYPLHLALLAALALASRQPSGVFS